jgi:hypothetical protein
MTDETNDDGLISVLVERLTEQRLPRALSLKEKVEAGERLSEFDIQFLEDVFNDASHIKPLLDRHPEYQELAAKMISLYNEITTRALENEKQGG